MKKPYKEIDLIEFQKKYRTEKLCERRLLSLDGLMDSNVPNVVVMGTLIYQDVSYFNAKNAAIKFL